jgi:hypothetical protein
MTKLLNAKLKCYQDLNNELIEQLSTNTKRIKLVNEYLEWSKSYNFVEYSNAKISKEHWLTIVKEIKDIK